MGQVDHTASFPLTAAGNSPLGERMLMMLRRLKVMAWLEWPPVPEELKDRIKSNHV